MVFKIYSICIMFRSIITGTGSHIPPGLKSHPLSIPEKDRYRNRKQEFHHQKILIQKLETQQ